MYEDRNYPEWPKLHPFIDNVLLEEVGSTCGNGMIHDANSLQIQGADDCPWCLSIMRDIARIAVHSRRVDALEELGKKLYVLDWDLDRILLSKTDPATADVAREDCYIRTWNLAEDGEIEWTFFEVIPDDDGSSHGEEKYSGRTYYHGC